MLDTPRWVIDVVNTMPAFPEYVRSIPHPARAETVSDCDTLHMLYKAEKSGAMVRFFLFFIFFILAVG